MLCPAVDLDRGIAIAGGSLEQLRSGGDTLEDASVGLILLGLWLGLLSGSRGGPLRRGAFQLVELIEGPTLVQEIAHIALLGEIGHKLDQVENLDAGGLAVERPGNPLRVIASGLVVVRDDQAVEPDQLIRVPIEPFALGLSSVCRGLARAFRIACRQLLLFLQAIDVLLSLHDVDDVSGGGRGDREQVIENRLPSPEAGEQPAIGARMVIRECLLPAGQPPSLLDVEKLPSLVRVVVLIFELPAIGFAHARLPDRQVRVVFNSTRALTAKSVRPGRGLRVWVMFAPGALFLPGAIDPVPLDEPRAAYPLSARSVVTTATDRAGYSVGEPLPWLSVGTWQRGSFARRRAG